MDLLNTTIANVQPTPAAAITATTTNGSAVNILDYEGPVVIVLDARNVAGATPTLDVKIQDSADGSTGWADVSGAAFTQVTTGQSSQRIVVDSNACKKFIRDVGTIGGTSTPSYIWSANLIGRKKYV